MSSSIRNLTLIVTKIISYSFLRPNHHSRNNKSPSLFLDIFIYAVYIQGVPEKITSQRLLYISIVKKATKLMFCWKEGFLPLVFNTEQPLSDIWLLRYVKLKLLNLKKETMIVRKFPAKTALHVCMFTTIVCMFVHTFLEEKKGFWLSPILL